MEEFNNQIIKNNPDYIININKKIIQKCSIIKCININEDLNFYLIKDNNNKHYISIEYSAPCYWIPLKNSSIDDNIKQIKKIYNISEYNTNMKYRCRAFIGTKEMLDVDINQIVNNLILNNNSEMYIWGSNWDDYPFERTYNSYNTFENINKTKEALKQINDDYYSIGFRTMYSKSIVNIIDYNGIYIVDINYNSGFENEIINKINNELSTDYPLNLPLDVIMFLNEFPFINHINILNLDKITETNIFISTLICADNKSKLSEIKNQLLKLVNHNDSKIKDAVNNLLKNID